MSKKNTASGWFAAVATILCGLSMIGIWYIGDNGSRQWEFDDNPTPSVSQDQTPDELNRLTELHKACDEASQTRPETWNEWPCNRWNLPTRNN